MAQQPATIPSSGSRTSRARRRSPGRGSRTRKRRAVLEARPEYAPIYKRTLEILDSKEKIPTPELLGDTVYNFWKDDVHERGIWRRTTLDSYRTAEPAVGDGPRRRRAREGGGQGLGLPRRDVPRARLRALHDQPLARRLGRAQSARVRHEEEGVRRRRLLPAGGEVAASPGATRTRCGSARTSGPGSLTASGYPAHREALEARHAARRGPDGLRGQAGRRRLGRKDARS